MKSSSVGGLPPYAVIAAALRKTTEALAREVATPQATAPEWSDFEWSVARAVCALQGISSLFATRLLWRGPDTWKTFLDGQRVQVLSCQQRIADLLPRLADAAVDAGWSYVALKGSALLSYSLHHPGDRPMSDIDLLIRPEDAALAASVIQRLGYERFYVSRRHDVFVPRERGTPLEYGESLSNPLRIELHQRVCEFLPVEAVDITSTIRPASLRPGNNPYASFASLMRHVALHASGNMRANAMRFMQIYDCALLARRMGASDWAELLGDDPRVSAWWLYPALSMAERYVPGSVPAEVLAELSATNPRRLVERFRHCQVSDVSWSNLRIAALPGLEWSRSLRDSIRFALSRAWPDRTALDELANTELAQPQLMRPRWYRASQAERIARWIFSRPPRVQTITTVRAALDAGTAYGR